MARPIAQPDTKLHDNGHCESHLTRRTAKNTSHENVGKVEEQRGKQPVTDGAGIAASILLTTVPAWLDAGVIIALIFGGCCGNVFALEAIVKNEPAAGPLITLSQFTTVALFTLPGHVSWDAGLRGFFLARRAIPLRSWLAYTAFFMSVNMLNNWAFAYRISVPLHIILRSAGPVASMAVGYLFNGRRYSPGQILAVVLLTCGVCGAALADAQAQGRSIHVGPDAGTSAGSFFTGIIILAIAMLLAAFQGVYVDRLYATHGNSHWREALFYSHLLSLPFFLPTYGQLTRQFRQMLTSPPLFETAASKSLLRFLDHLPGPVLRTLAGAPSLIIYLVLNGLTQYACIRGVYLLAAKSSSLTVTIVLNIRKLVSLLLSIYLFGNRLAPGVLLGAVLVFLGGALYGIEGARRRRVVKVA